MSAKSKKIALKFSDNNFTLREVLDKVHNDGPLLVKTNGQMDFTVAFRYKSDKLPPGQLLLLEQVRTISYELVRVLKYHSEEKVMSQKGGDFVLEHNNYVDSQLFIPLKYEGKFNLVHPPTSRRRYASVTKIIEDLPQYLKVHEDTMSVPPAGSGNSKLAQAGSLLSVSGVVTGSNCRYLECVDDDDNQSYLFSENARVNFTAEYSEDQYTLTSVPQRRSPTCVQFEHTSPSDIVIEDDEKASTVLIILSGPLRLIKKKKRKFLIGWFRDKREKTFRTVLIPDGLWDIETVRLAKFQSDRERMEFLDTRFWPCNDSSFVNEKLYLRQEDKTSLTYLKSPVFANLGIRLTECFSSDDGSDSEDYEIPDHPPSPPPPVPDGSNSGDYEIPDHPPSQPPPVPARMPRRHSDTASARVEEQMPTEHAVPHEPIFLPIKLDDRKNFRKMVFHKARIGFDKVHEELRKNLLRKTSKGKPKPNVVTRSKSRELPKVPASDVPETSFTDGHEYDELDSSAMLQPPNSPQMSQGKPSYVSLTRLDLADIAKRDQTKEDFYRYGVTEVSECFKMCGEQKLAKYCLEQKFDGAFFEGTDVQFLAESPLCLSEVSITKVKKAISGWRPKT